jgi:hypothetical protein
MIFRALFHASVIVVLTALTQIGGLVWLLALGARRVFNLPLWGGFIGLYLTAWAATMVIAPMLGRVPLPCLQSDAATPVVLSPLTCALNRQYVTPALATQLGGVALHINEKFPGTTTLILDANFPFLDGFPLLPHLSHDDGRKVDLAFYYQDRSGVYQAGKTPSPIGYWVFEPPRANDPQPCRDQGSLVSLRWDMGIFQPRNPALVLEPVRTRTALTWLAQNPPPGRTSKILLEPHLRKRLGLTHASIRFQGCRAARHDDHIHYQISL